MLDLMTFCKKIEPFVLYYKRLIKSYKNMAHNILENEINLILPQIPRKQKCGIITTLVSSFIGLAYEGISSFLYHKQNKALHKAVRVVDSKATIQCNKVITIRNFNVNVWNLQCRNIRINSLILYTVYTTQHPCMRDCLQDSKAH